MADVALSIVGDGEDLPKPSSGRSIAGRDVWLEIIPSIGPGTRLHAVDSDYRYSELKSYPTTRSHIGAGLSPSFSASPPVTCPQVQRFFIGVQVMCSFRWQLMAGPNEIANLGRC